MELKDGVVTLITVEVGRDDENFNVSVIKLYVSFQGKKMEVLTRGSPVKLKHNTQW